MPTDSDSHQIAPNLFNSNLKPGIVHQIRASASQLLTTPPLTPPAPKKSKTQRKNSSLSTASHFRSTSERELPLRCLLRGYPLKSEGKIRV
jgi:hypothetical protein